MDYLTIIDKFGRIQIPEEIRAKLGLRDGTPLEVTVGGEIVVRPCEKSLEERVEEAVNFLSENGP